MSKQKLHGVVVWLWQRLDQITNIRQLCVIVSLSDGFYEFVKVTEWEKWLRKLSEKQLQRSSDHVHILPLAILQVQLLVISLEAQFLNNSEVSTHSVKAIDV